MSRIVLEHSKVKHRSLLSATGRFVLMIVSKDRFLLFFFCRRSLCMYLFVSVSWSITLRRQCWNTFTIESTCQPQALFKLAVSVCTNCKCKCFFCCLESNYWGYPFENNIFYNFLEFIGILGINTFEIIWASEGGLSIFSQQKSNRNVIERRLSMSACAVKS